MTCVVWHNVDLLDKFVTTRANKGVHTDQLLEVSIEAEDAPNDEGLIFGKFTFTANRPGFSGTGRSAAAFVEQSQTSFDSRLAAQN